MTIAEMIKKTRTENNMTQEEYANCFFVSRQTVSSWENGKSTPELQTLINICNTYHMSLDELLDGDRNYVKRTSRLQKGFGRLKYVIPIIGVLLCAYLIYVGAWNARNKAMVEEYRQQVLSLGYVRAGKIYELKDNNIVYQAGNQELPRLKWEFSNKRLYARYKDEEMIWNVNFTAEDGTGYFYFEVNVDSAIAGEISDDDVITYTEIKGLAESVLKEQRPQIEKIIQTMNRHWHVIYD